jgi:hypothetical protein
LFPGGPAQSFFGGTLTRYGEKGSIAETRMAKEMDYSFKGMRDRLPKWLYRYQSVSGERMEWIRRLLIDSNLYFTPSRAFNDPLDCRISSDFNSSRLRAEQYWRRMGQYLPGGARQHKKRINELVRMGRTVRGQEQLNELIYTAVNKHGIVSTSERPASVLMWSYYAEGHAGIVVRFRMDHDLSFTQPVVPVQVRYSADFPRMKYYEVSNEERIHTIIGTKANAWEHEREWRLVASKTGYVGIEPLMIDGVILGLRIQRENETAVRDWVQQRKTPTELLRIGNKKDSFELEVTSA